MIYQEKKILLGSGSPRRKLLFEQLGMNFRVRVSNFDESFASTLSASEIANFIAVEKSTVLLNELKDDEILITADTIVWFNKTFLGKPSDEEKALEMLRQLNGNKHEVYSGVCLRNKTKIKSFVEKSYVYFRKVKDEDLRNYISEFKPFDKAGSYGAQECLPDGYYPCSREEYFFLKIIGKENLYLETSIDHSAKIPLIDHIKGSYFNVMGLPIVEMVKEIENF